MTWETVGLFTWSTDTTFNLDFETYTYRIYNPATYNVGIQIDRKQVVIVPAIKYAYFDVFYSGPSTFNIKASNTGTGYAIERQLRASKKIKDQIAGMRFKFAGYTVRLLNPADGLVHFETSIINRKFDNSSSNGGNSIFNLTGVENIGYYLNTTFFNTLTQNEKAAIIENSWPMRDYNGKTINPVIAKIALISDTEWSTYGIAYGRETAVIPNPIEIFWTRSQAIGNGAYAVKTDGNFTSSQALDGIYAIRPILKLNPDLSIVNGEILYNTVPTIAITSPVANQTFHENSTLTMVGSTVDTDADDVVTIKYQIDSGTVRNLHSAVSDGSTPIDFSKSLTYKDGVLKDGATTVTSTLDKDVPHTVSMWAEDGKGGKSTIITRSFFVVPNRAPQVTISPITQQSALINSDVITVSGAVVDLDHNEVTVTFSINGGEEQQVYQGPPSAFTFNILLANLKTGVNTVIVKATDTYNMSATKTLTINKTHDAVPVNTAVARYQIVAPTGSAQSILLWVTRTLGNLGINAAVSLTNANEAENYVDLTPTNTGVVNGNREDEFAYQGTVSKEKIILKITYNRTDANVIDTIKQISGVLF